MLLPLLCTAADVELNMCFTIAVVADGFVFVVAAAAAEHDLEPTRRCPWFYHFCDLHDWLNHRNTSCESQFLDTGNSHSCAVWVCCTMRSLSIYKPTKEDLTIWLCSSGWCLGVECFTERSAEAQVR